MNQYKNAAVTNIKSDLNYDRSGFHKVSIDIIFMHEGSGFETVMNAYGDLVEDIHQLLLKSKQTIGDDDLPLHPEVSD